MEDRTLTYEESIDWLFGLQFFGIKLGLENIRALAETWGNPERQYPVVHVAGTNGKGSTASFIAAGLQAAGYRTGLYTSPHLVDFTERIRVDGVPIPRQRVAEYARRLHPDIERRNATFFEATTLMAFQYFADCEVDVAVIETGMGGRLDATNIVVPALTVITSLSLDHREHLGDTIADIAREKAGIIKPGVPAVVAPSAPEAEQVVAARCRNQVAALHMLPAGGEVHAWRDLDAMDCLLPEFPEPVSLGLVGRHQIENARLAVRALRLLGNRGFPRIDEIAIREGLQDVRRHTGLRGRLERLQAHPELVIDVGHNPEGIRVMLETWSALRDPRETDFVFGVLKSKDLSAMFSVLANVPLRSLTLVEAESHEAQPLNRMLASAREAGLHAATASRVSEGVSSALARQKTGSVLLFGSHYVVGGYLRSLISSE